jgi:diguanylate cyclase (GGDEF)-like protein
MLSLYSALLAQHPRQLTPVRCAELTIAQLQRYFEDVVVENNLSALVVESLLPENPRPLRDLARVREVARAARYSFFLVSPDDGLKKLPPDEENFEREPIILRHVGCEENDERFVVIADARFSALIASVHPREAGPEAGDEVVWSFEPDVVYTALEYLMARLTAELPEHAPRFARAVRSCMPKTTSLHLTVTVTTKLAQLLQEQAVREVAVNRISTAIRSSLELPSVLQTTVNEVGRALVARHCALSVEGEPGQPPLTTCYFHDGVDEEACRDQIIADLHAYDSRMRGRMNEFVQDGAGEPDAPPVAVVPVIFQERTLGVLFVGSEDPRRVWRRNEILLMRTVADQVAVAVNHARLFAQMQQQALTDPLTGCFNRRFFEIQLERDMHLATRSRQPVSLVMLDIDHFKLVNDRHGHDAGDAALRHIAGALRRELRGVDTAARYGGEEFAVILPQAGIESAMVVAERLRAHIEEMVIPNVGNVTASLGVASFPEHASSRELLVTVADRALYQAKREGRNRVCPPPADAARHTPAPDRAPDEASEKLRDEARDEVRDEVGDKAPDDAGAEVRDESTGEQPLPLVAEEVAESAVVTEN